MATTYSPGYQIKLIGTGLESTTWGTSTNENLSRIEDALGGCVVVKVEDVTSPSTWTSGTRTLIWACDDDAVAGTAGTSATAVGSGRVKVVVFADGADIGGDLNVKIRGNTASDLPDRLIFVKNGLRASRKISFNMNTGDDNSDFDLLNGNSAVIYTNATAKGPSGNIAANSVNNALDSLQLGSMSVGTGAAAGVINSSGNQDLSLKSGHLTDASIVGNITITDGTNGDISLTPHGAGTVVAKKFQISEFATQGAGLVPFTTTDNDGTFTEDAANFYRHSSGKIVITTLDTTTLTAGTIKNTATGTNCVAIGNAALDSAISGVGQCVAIGENAGTALNHADNDACVMVGYNAGQNVEGAGAKHVTAIGAYCGLMDGLGNTSVGFKALSDDGSATGDAGTGNVAVGYKAMGDCSNGGDDNIAIGNSALIKGGAASSHDHIAIGVSALGGVEQSTSDDEPNLAIGKNSGFAVGSGGKNTLIGHRCCENSVSGTYGNTAVGYKSLHGNADDSFDGVNNAALGAFSLSSVQSTAANNTCIGFDAGGDITNGDRNTLIGAGAGASYTTGSGNIALGYLAGPTSTSTLSNQLTIDNAGNSDPTLSFIYGDMTTGDRKVSITQESTTHNDTCLTLSSKSTNRTGTLFEVVTEDAGTETDYYFAKFTNQTGGESVVWSVRGDGQTTAAGTVLDGADYAEFFEWSDGNAENEDRIGLSVVLDGNGKCRVATSGDDAEDIFGVVSATANTVGDAAWSAWGSKFKMDDFGRLVYEDGEKVKNPDWDPDLEYIPREERREWEIIGLMGKIRLRKGSPVNPSWRKMRDISSVSEEWLVR